MTSLLKKTVALAGFMFAATCAMAQAEKVVEVNLVDADGGAKPVGTVTLVDSKYGLVLTPNLTGLAAGVHGFHIHTNPACGPLEKDGKNVPALAAGGHFDPTNTGKHGTPWGEGHLGDLPALFVDTEGKAVYPVLAPRLTLKDVEGRSLMVHAGGENHSDNPAPLGGGGARIACGVIK